MLVFVGTYLTLDCFASLRTGAVLWFPVKILMLVFAGTESPARAGQAPILLSVLRPLRKSKDRSTGAAALYCPES